MNSHDFADFYEAATDFLDEHNQTYDAASLAAELNDLPNDIQEEGWDYIEADDYDGWVEFCIENGIQYH